MPSMSASSVRFEHVERLPAQRARNVAEQVSVASVFIDLTLDLDNEAEVSEAESTRAQVGDIPDRSSAPSPDDAMDLALFTEQLLDIHRKLSSDQGTKNERLATRTQRR